MITTNKWKIPNVIPNVGVIHSELMKDLDGSESAKIAEELLKKITEGIAKNSVDYYERTQGIDHIFFKSEKAINTTVCTTIYNNITRMVKMEFPILRKHKKVRKGLLDYWLFYKDIAFALELKLSHKGHRASDYTKERGIFDDFNKAIDQLENVENDDSPYFMPRTKGLIKIALEIIVFNSEYKSSIRIKKNRLEDYRQNIRKNLDLLIRIGESKTVEGLKFKKKINFKAIWFPEEKFVYLKPKLYDKYIECPALGFIGHVSDIFTMK